MVHTRRALPRRNTPQPLHDSFGVTGLLWNLHESSQGLLPGDVHSACVCSARHILRGGGRERLVGQLDSRSGAVQRSLAATQAHLDAAGPEESILVSTESTS